MSQNTNSYHNVVAPNNTRSSGEQAKHLDSIELTQDKIVVVNSSIEDNQVLSDNDQQAGQADGNNIEDCIQNSKDDSEFYEHTN